MLWVLSAANPVSAQGGESVCAGIRIEFRRELTLERQAFEASMRINNGLDTFLVDNVDINALFQDENGDPVVASSDSSHPTAKFFSIAE